MYFSVFPYINYQFPDDQIRVFKNISIRPGLVEEFFGSSSNFEEYIVQDGDTPESIAHKVFKDVNLHWTIMLANKIINIYTDWPMSTQQFDDHLFSKYKMQKTTRDSDVELTRTEVSELIEWKGSPLNNFQTTNSKNVVLKPHHFEDDEGNEYSFDTVVSSTNKDAFGRTINAPETTPVSIYEFEFLKNEKNRSIIIPKANIARRMKNELSNHVNS